MPRLSVLNDPIGYCENDTDRQLASDPPNDELLITEKKIIQYLEVHAVHERARKSHRG